MENIHITIPLTIQETEEELEARLTSEESHVYVVAKKLYHHGILQRRLTIGPERSWTQIQGARKRGINHLNVYLKEQQQPVVETTRGDNQYLDRLLSTRIYDIRPVEIILPLPDVRYLLKSLIDIRTEVQRPKRQRRHTPSTVTP